MRNYKEEYQNYQGTPVQKKRRAQRNSARRIMSDLGRVKKGDGKDVHHKSGMSNNLKNLAVMTKHLNRSIK